MAEIKTRKTEGSVEAFLESVKNTGRREDARAVTRLMQKITGVKPKMWGPSIIGFGQYRYKYASGREGEMCAIGLSPRQQALTLYVVPFPGSDDALKKLGKHKTGKCCLYINRLSDIDQSALETIIRGSYDLMRKASPEEINELFGR
jgi:hypothetical protein